MNSVLYSARSVKHQLVVRKRKVDAEATRAKRREAEENNRISYFLSLLDCQMSQQDTVNKTETDGDSSRPRHGHSEARRARSESPLTVLALHMRQNQ